MTQQSNFREKKLNTNIDVYSFPSSSHSFTLSLYIRSGVLYEEEEENGYSHFFEHAVFRNINHIMSQNLYRELDKNALTFSGATYNEQIQFSVSGSSSAFKTAADILILALSDLVITKEELESEKERVKREIREDTYSSSVDALLQKEVWRGTPLSQTITGSVGKVSKITLSSLKRFRDKILFKENIFFSLTGAVGEEEENYLVARVKECNLKSAQKRENNAVLPSNFFHRSPDIVSKRADFCKVKLSFDVDNLKVKKPFRDLIYDMLFQGDTSRIFLELSEKCGYVYSFDANFEEYRNVGLITLSFETCEKDFLSAFRKALELLTEPFDKECLDFAKAPYIKNWLFVLDDSDALNWNKSYESRFLGFDYETLEERQKSYIDADSDTINIIAKTIFKKENLTVAIKHRKPEKAELAIREIIQNVFSE